MKIKSATARAAAKVSKKSTGKPREKKGRSESRSSARAASAQTVALGVAAPAGGGVGPSASIVGQLPSVISGAAARLQQGAYHLLSGNASSAIDSANEDAKAVLPSSNQSNQSIREVGPNAAVGDKLQNLKQADNSQRLKDKTSSVLGAVEEKANRYVSENQVDVVKMSENVADLDGWIGEHLGKGRFTGWGRKAIEEAIMLSPSMAYAAMDVIEKNPDELNGVMLSVLHRMAHQENTLGTVSSLIDGRWREEISRSMKSSQ